MTSSRTATHLALAVLAAVAVFAHGAGARSGMAEGDGDALPDLRGDGPVVVELFTSQGCSSCPPADRLLTRLGARPGLRSRLFPLAFHVDYWNHIGWTDPFSSKRWSERQRRYARELSGGRVYTPQLVVNGRAETVGNQEEEVIELVRRALAREPAASLHVRLPAPESPETLRARVTAKMMRPPQHGRRRPLDLLVALYQEDLTTPVPRGENQGRTLENDYVVRHLERAGELPARAGAETEASVTFELEPDWPRPDLGVVAFVQDPRTLIIQGAARATLESIR